MHSSALSGLDVFKTARLNVRRLQPETVRTERNDTLLEEIQAVLAPAVLHHLPTPMQPTEADDRILQWLVARLAESEFYLVRCAQTSTLLGLMVLAEQTEQYGPDIVRVGYMLAQDAWGRGYATELVNGLVSALRGGGQPVRLLAGVGKDNTPSMRVLVKAGFAIDSDLSDNRTRVFSLAVAQCKDLRD